MSRCGSLTRFRVVWPQLGQFIATPTRSPCPCGSTTVRHDGNTGFSRASLLQYSRHGQLPRCTCDRATSASSSPTGSVRPVNRLRNSTSTGASGP